MFEKWLDEQTASLHTVKITCCGDYKVGKSEFLRKYAGDPYPGDSEDAGEVFVRLLKEHPLRIGVQLLQLPSSTNLDHQTCYTSDQEDAVVFFFDTSTKKLKEHLSQWVRHHFQSNPSRMWEVPILLIGLKKDRLTPLQFAQERSKKLWETRDLFRGDNMLFFGRDCEECDYQRELEHFHAFVRRIAEHKIYATVAYRRYQLKPTAHSFWLLFSVPELVRLGFKHSMNWIWSRVSRTVGDKLPRPSWRM